MAAAAAAVAAAAMPCGSMTRSLRPLLLLVRRAMGAVPAGRRALCMARGGQLDGVGRLAGVRRRQQQQQQEWAVRAITGGSVVSEVPVADEASGTYDSSQIQVLEGLDAVRKRPGMYIGSTGTKGLHHLVYEVLDNAVDEAQAGFATTVEVELYADGSVSVTDDGRGIPTDVHPVTKKSAVETVLTMLHAGGKFGGESSGYSVSGGLHGVGISVVNALSERLEVTVWRGGREYRQTFSRGKPVTELESSQLPKGEARRTGTRVLFLPDPRVFLTTRVLDYDTIASRLRELAFLNPQLRIGLKQVDAGAATRVTEYHFAGGLAEYVAWLDADKKQIHDPIVMRREREGVVVDVALQWCADAYSDTLLGYANSIRTSDGGTHMDGFKSAVTRAINALGRKTKFIKEKDENLNGEHVREGLTGIVSVKVPNPEFEGQTKTRLGNPEVRKLVDQLLHESLTEYLELHPATLEAILAKAVDSYKAAVAAKTARELVRRKNSQKSFMLPGKLAECTWKDPKATEIFLVEGDSAGGSTKQGRDRRFQAVLPLRGKIINIEKKDSGTIYKNQEIQNMILALGLGVKGEDFKMDALRYHKIIILTDADVDGAHIRTLLLTFFFRYQKSLFDEGTIYIGVPPLYKVDRGKQSKYCFTEDELKATLKSFPASSHYTIQRFKGLGEMMPQQLWETTLDPSRRMLKQMTVEDAAAASMMFSLLMGDKVEPRKQHIQAAASRINLRKLDL